MNISIIVPVYFEGSLVKIAHERISTEIRKNFENFEIIFVDDGSTDDTFVHLSELAAQNAHVKVIKFSANAGSHMAIRAGLAHATGDAACFIACDMQEPPYLIHEMFKALHAPYEIVWAVRNTRKDPAIGVLFSKTFYFFARRIVSKNIPPSGASMFLISRKVLDALKQYDERNLTLEGLFATMGFRSNYIKYEREQRLAGKSKWTIGKKIKLFIDFFVAYSYFPIRFVSITGITFALAGFLYAAYIIVRYFMYDDLSPGWPALISILLFGFGITNISLGIIAEYLWRTLDEARKRPKYIIEHKLNL
jgi:dolichol-phosphate mannosyltransferase